MIALGPLNFLRPEWLYALLALPLLWWWLRRRRAESATWRRAVDPHLLPHLLVRGNASTHRLAAIAATLAYTLAVVALAGPAWRQVDAPTWEAREPLVVAVDLSSAVLATDVPPTRLAQLRARLTRLLQAKHSGPIALVAFADDAFTVAPLTDDAANVALFVDALEPAVMPVDGQSPARAIAQSRELIERAGFPRGRIVLVTDHADGTAQRAARDARDAGITVSALGVGTPAGAELRTLGGQSVHVQLDEGSMRGLASNGGGDYAPLALDGSDDAVFATGEGAAARRGLGGGRTWADEGFRLVPFVMLFALIALARRPRAAALLLVVALLPRPSLAADVFLRADQRGWRSVDRGVDAYRRGKFDQAAQDFAKADTADAHYNRGNALAKAGHLEDAVAAYDEALRRQPGMADAIANRAAVLRAMKKPPPKGGQQQQPGQQGGASSHAQQGRNCAPGDSSCNRQSNNQQNAKGNAPKQNASSPPKPADAKQQAKADAAQRERMQRALQQAQAQQQKAPTQPMTPQQRERRMSDEAALMRVPDEPGTLLREKFRLEYERRQLGGGR
ncbi:tetratricopeptide repeat protein [Cognatilysobacter terrigena]|uniref:tetratricopeptide repeat protein n=1 Tax=Cognatilysobacter terrigena TaxID=2488749 RepID=UPI00105CD31F|nr:tetratricopeptide repeat protein [Lysobacter terrigena]